MSKTKICYKCKQNLSINCFKKHKNRKDGLQADCISCQKEYRKLHYLKNKTKYKLKSKNSQIKNRKWFQEYKKTLKCNRCEENHPACLQFHHKNKDLKIKAISAMMSMSLDTIKNEILKCEVLCANCHFKEHYING